MPEYLHKTQANPGWGLASRPPCAFNFSRSTSSEMTCDNQGMAATVEEGTAPKLVLVNAGKQFPIASVNSDSRKDGNLSPSVCVFNKHIKPCCEGFGQAGGKQLPRWQGSWLFSAHG